MHLRWQLWGWLGVLVPLACSVESGGGDDGATGPEGTLACDRTPVECRTAFAGDYNGSFAGDDSGRLTFFIDVLGGLSGTAAGDVLGMQAMTGRVNEFGRIEFSIPDGTSFTGQFAEDHSCQGSWSGPPGQGTFTCTSAAPGAGNDGGAGDGGSDASSPEPSLEALLSAVEQACEHLAECGQIPIELCAEVLPASQTSCLSEQLAHQECNIGAPCDALFTACESVSATSRNCIANAGGEFDPPLTGLESFDRATHVCSACSAEAMACYDSLACFYYALCIDSCGGDASCVEGCAVTNSSGAAEWNAAIDCGEAECGT
jgi:hypothetical protein